MDSEAGEKMVLGPSPGLINKEEVKGRSPPAPTHTHKLALPAVETFQSPQALGQHLTSWVVALQSTNASVEVGAVSDRLVGELSLDK